jgi:ketosteroid isomerase-like protein
MTADTVVPTAAELAASCLDLISKRDAAAVGELFSEDGQWELAYAFGRISNDHRVLQGRHRITRFHAQIAAFTISVAFSDVEVSVVDDRLAFVECRSEAQTIKGVPYRNYYMVKVVAEQGTIRRWLEFFDPRPSEVLQDLMAAGTGSAEAGA